LEFIFFLTLNRPFPLVGCIPCIMSNRGIELENMGLMTSKL